MCLKELAESLARQEQATKEAAANPTAKGKGRAKAIPEQSASASNKNLWKDVDEDGFFGASKPVGGDEDEEAEVPDAPSVSKSE